MSNDQSEAFGSQHSVSKRVCVWVCVACVHTCIRQEGSGLETRRPGVNSQLSPGQVPALQNSDFTMRELVRMMSLILQQMLTEHPLHTHQALCWAHRLSCKQMHKVPVLLASRVVDKPTSQPGNWSTECGMEKGAVRSTDALGCGQCDWGGAAEGRACRRTF